MAEEGKRGREPSGGRAGPNKALHLTRPASALPGVRSSLARAGQVSLVFGCDTKSQA
jgi:hypothetical protein